jgi:beta-carotene 15,15'-dioxygenase
MRELRWLTWVPLLGASILVALSMLSPTTATGLAWPVAVVGAALGIPHGAVDHLVPGWWGAAADASTGGGGPARGWLARFVGGYVLLAGLALLALLLAPAPALVIALVLSAAHFGRGEVVTGAERAGRAAPGPLEQWPATTMYGGVTVGLLLWSDPALSGPTLRAMSPWVADAVAATRGPGLILLAVGAGTAVLVLLSRRRWLEAGELALLATMFVVAPPLAAFGWYFGGWHAVRHTGRLLDLARSTPAVGWADAGRSLARAGALPTLVALLAVLWLWSARDLAGLHAELAVLLALTVPHSVVVWALDRREARADRSPSVWTGTMTM